MTDKHLKANIQYLFGNESEPYSDSLLDSFCALIKEAIRLDTEAERLFCKEVVRGKIKGSLRINQQVRRNYKRSWIYWVDEIDGDKILIRTTESKDDPEYDDFWVNRSELIPIGKRVEGEQFNTEQ